jgi:hypothetical protein
MSRDASSKCSKVEGKVKTERESDMLPKAEDVMRSMASK